MDQLMNVILTIVKVHTAPHRALDCVPGLGGLNQVYGPNDRLFTCSIKVQLCPSLVVTV